jgi:hypothetical protein
MTVSGYAGLNAYYGDIHNHCGISYGKGTLAEAFQNARLQLDFASVTVHAHWPDIPVDDPRLAYLVDYHEKGFEEALARWPEYQQAVEAAHEPGAFVTLPSFEWHSMAYGDHVVYFKDTAASHIIPAADIDAMRSQLRQLAARGIQTFLIPHHIGYRTGYRGINWATYASEFSPIVEMISFHGLSEHSEAPFPYWHSMGPRDGRSTIQHGLMQGHRFGLVGSTDHHSAHPGHYGYGKLAVWADALTRDSIWDAIAARRTYALSGDRIALQAALNGHPMGSAQAYTTDRTLEVAVTGGDALETVEVLYNNQVVDRWHPPASPDTSGPYKVFVEVGWGEESTVTEWTVDLAVEQGRLLAVEPRLRGHAIEAPPADIEGRFCFSQLTRPSGNQVQLNTVTWRNPTVTTPATQGVCLTIEGDMHTQITGRANNRDIRYALGELQTGARVEYLSGFVSPAICVHRAVPASAYAGTFTSTHHTTETGPGWYYVRVRQQNGHYAWSSPFWVDGAQ